MVNENHLFLKNRNSSKRSHSPSLFPCDDLSFLFTSPPVLVNSFTIVKYDCLIILLECFVMTCVML